VVRKLVIYISVFNNKNNVNFYQTRILFEVNSDRIGNTFCAKYEDNELILVDCSGVEQVNFIPHPINTKIEFFDLNKLISNSIAV